MSSWVCLFGGFGFKFQCAGCGHCYCFYQGIEVAHTISDTVDMNRGLWASQKQMHAFKSTGIAVREITLNTLHWNQVLKVLNPPPSACLALLVSRKVRKTEAFDPALNALNPRRAIFEATRRKSA